MTASTKHNNRGGGESQTWHPPLLLSVKDVKRKCDCGKQRALELIHAAGMIRLGRRVYVRPSTLDEYLAGLEQRGRDQ
jgi:hypothetical protein